MGDELCWTKTRRDIASPLEGEVPISYHTQIYNGSFLKENVYRQDASPEVDAAREALGVNYRPMAIPVEKAATAGLMVNVRVWHAVWLGQYRICI